MQNAQEHKEQAPPPSVWQPSVPCEKKGISLKVRVWDTDGGAIRQASHASVPRECTM